MSLPKSIKLEVTQDDIICGTANDPWACPIARATLRALKPQEPKEVCVTGSILEIDNRIIPTTKKMQRFITRYDRCPVDKRSRIRPESFTLNLR